jgi:adenylate kinase
MASRLAEEMGIPHISTGDMFRAAMAKETELGLKAKAIMAAGDLVPDELTIAMVKERLAEADAQKGYILDGFPRTIPQAEALDGFATIEKAVRFDVQRDMLIRRLSGRRVHKPSGRIYHVEFSPPKVAGKDDVTGDDLIQRDDDKEDAIRNRLSVYDDQTAPLIEYYEKKGNLVTVDAAPAPDEVFAALKKLLQ